jgi:hypothetical protein
MTWAYEEERLAIAAEEQEAYERALREPDYEAAMQHAYQAELTMRRIEIEDSRFGDSP